MKSYQDRADDIAGKASKIKSRKKAITSVVASTLAVAVICTAVALPIALAVRPDKTNSWPFIDISGYEKDDYYPLISKLNDYRQTHNGYIDDDFLVDDAVNNGGVAVPEAPEAGVSGADGAVPGASAPGASDGSTSKDKYEENTLNQVEGVTEGDIVKRSSSYAFRLSTKYDYDTGYDANGKYFVNNKRTVSLSVYSLAKADSACIATYTIDSKENLSYYMYANEMYLSDDATTATIISVDRDDMYNTYTAIISLDVSNPLNITEKARTLVSGSYLSSRKVNGELLVVTTFYIGRTFADYDNPARFVPACGSPNDLRLFPMNEICLPEEISTCSYNVIVKVKEQGLEVTDKIAALSYLGDMAVSKEHLYLTRSSLMYMSGNTPISYADITEKRYKKYSSVNKTDVVCLNYKDELSVVGGFSVEGYIKDRYSIDEKDGIVRIVTTVSGSEYQLEKHFFSGEQYEYYNYVTGTLNASLYCISLKDMSLVASVVNFAPAGENVRSVRFDGDTAYVCTAVRNTDPVYMFDLSDLKNIKVKDTGTIPGWSISLITFGDLLVGIGYAQSTGSLKIELYSESESTVQSVCSYEKDRCYFSTEYKSHYIDAERGLIGLHVRYYNDSSYYTRSSGYLLLQWDGEQLNVCFIDDVNCEDSREARAFYADGLYIVTDDEEKGIYYYDVDALFA